ncbi:MAG: DUF2934 domain-containing protein [Candidatus Sedimenticola sp. 20ELBAFRAG]
MPDINKKTSVKSKKTSVKKKVVAKKKAAAKKKVVKKRVASTTKKAAPRKKAAAKRASSNLSNDKLNAQYRYEMIATVAHHRAAERDFAPGHELSDWLWAETVIDDLLKKSEEFSAG